MLRDRIQSKLNFLVTKNGKFFFHFTIWTSRSGAMYVFLSLSRDKFKNTPLAPLCEFHKINIFQETIGSKWTVPSDFLGKKKQLLFNEGL